MLWVNLQQVLVERAGQLEITLRFRRGLCLGLQLPERQEKPRPVRFLAGIVGVRMAQRRDDFKRVVISPVNADDGRTGGSVTVLLNRPAAFAGQVVSLDIKPGGCPNSLNRKSGGFLSVALEGASDFDTTMIDVGSVLLSRVDGIGGSVAPNEGPPGPHSVLADVATPFDGELCGCHELQGDDILDLSMKFKTQRIVEELQLSNLSGGTFVGLVASGTLFDGTPFMASDCIRIVPASDIDGDGAVGAADLLLLLGALGPCTSAQECLADMDQDGYVSISDLLTLLANRGSPAGSAPQLLPRHQDRPPAVRRSTGGPIKMSPLVEPD